MGLESGSVKDSQITSNHVRGIVSWLDTQPHMRLRVVYVITIAKTNFWPLLKGTGNHIWPDWITRVITTHGVQIRTTAGFRCVCVCVSVWLCVCVCRSFHTITCVHTSIPEVVGHSRVYYARKVRDTTERIWLINPLMQVDFLRPVVISQVATQGAKERLQSQYVVNYTISYSTDRKSWIFFKGDSPSFRKVSAATWMPSVVYRCFSDTTALQQGF